MIFDELYVDTLSPVGRAVQTDNMELLRELLQNGYSTNEADNRGWVPLVLAAHKGSVEAVQLLLTADDIEVEKLSHDGRSAMCLACSSKSEAHTKVVELLLAAGASGSNHTGDCWVTPLLGATENNNLEVVRLLLDHGVNPNQEVFKSASALHGAAEVGAFEVAQLLLERGGNLEIKDETTEHTALHILCLNYKKDNAATYNKMLELFLSYPCDVNAQCSGVTPDEVDDDFEPRTEEGTTPLMLAVQSCWDKAVDLLLEKGADVHLVQTQNVLPVHFAIQYYPEPLNGSPREDGKDGQSVLRKLLSRTSLDKISLTGFSIFHLGIYFRSHRGIQILIESGLNPDEFVQEMDTAIIDCEDYGKHGPPLLVKLHTEHDTPLGYLIFQSLTQDVVDLSKYMIDKGSSINALRPGLLPPLVAALKNRSPDAYEDGGYGQQILQYLLAQGVDIMYKTRESNVLPDALLVSSLFNVVGFFRLLQHGVPAHRIYTYHTLTALMQYYQNEQFYRVYKVFPWLVLSWLNTANMFIPQLPLDTVTVFNTDCTVPDENLSQGWQELRSAIASPKCLQQLSVLRVRQAMGEARGWQKLQDSLEQLNVHTVLPEPILDLLHFRWVKTNTLLLGPPASSRHLYVTSTSQSSDDDEEL